MKSQQQIQISRKESSKGTCKSFFRSFREALKGRYSVNLSENAKNALRVRTWFGVLVYLLVNLTSYPLTKLRTIVFGGSFKTGTRRASVKESHELEATTLDWILYCATLLLLSLWIISLKKWHLQRYFFPLVLFIQFMTQITSSTSILNDSRGDVDRMQALDTIF